MTLNEWERESKINIEIRNFPGIRPVLINSQGFASWTGQTILIKALQQRKGFSSKDFIRLYNRIAISLSITAPWSPSIAGWQSGRRRRQWSSTPKHHQRRFACIVCSSRCRQPGASWRPGRERGLDWDGDGVFRDVLPFHRKCRCIWSAG